MGLTTLDSNYPVAGSNLIFSGLILELYPSLSSPYSANLEEGLVWYGISSD